MPVTKSATKKMRQDIKRRKVNRLKKERLKSLIKKAKKEPAERNVRAAISFIDKAIKTDLIHQNKAARLKSHLAKLLIKAGRPSGRKKGKALRTKRKTKTITSKKVLQGKPS